MKLNQLLTTALVTIGMALCFVTLFSIAGPATSVHAMTGYDYNQTLTRHAVATKKMLVYKVRVGASEAQNRFFKVGEIHKGTHFKTSAWIMSTGGGYVVKYAHHQPSKHYFYFVVANENKQWFK